MLDGMRPRHQLAPQLVTQPNPKFPTPLVN